MQPAASAQSSEVVSSVTDSQSESQSEPERDGTDGLVKNADKDETGSWRTEDEEALRTVRMEVEKKGNGYEISLGVRNSVAGCTEILSGSGKHDGNVLYFRPGKSKKSTCKIRMGLDVFDHNFAYLSEEGDCSAIRRDECRVKTDLVRR